MDLLLSLLLPLLLSTHLSTVHCLPLQGISDELYERATKLLGNDLSYYSHSSPHDIDKRILPEIGNGHIGTQMRNKCIFVNGLYNGRTTASRRACIPSLLNWDIRTKDALIRRTFSLDSLIGVITDVFVYCNYNISITTYVSRDFRQIIIRNVSLEMSEENDTAVTVTTTGTDFNFSSADIDFDVSNHGDILIMEGLTKVAENNYTERLPIFVISEDIPRTIVLKVSRPWQSFVTSIDNNFLQTYKAFKKASRKKEKLLYNHAKAWIDTWDDGMIQITDSDPYLIQSIHAAQYYILTALPFKDWSKTEPSWSFYGLSPGGLAHGNTEDDYLGHVFWDMETWMYPTFLYFHRESAISMMKYRLIMLQTAIQHSANTGFKGARYPWESARTGFETSPSRTCARNEIHINGDISYAVQQLLWMESKSNVFLYDEFSKTIIENIAMFWESRITENCQENRNEIWNVMPPDEYVHVCNNSAFTNVIARVSLEAPSLLAQRFGQRITPQMSEWFQIAQDISYVTDEQSKIILEHDKYKMGTIIKQADVMLLYHPLHIDVPQEYFDNSQSYYEKVTDIEGPAMTWAIYSINWFKSKNITKAEKFFKNNYGYINKPYYVWSEGVNGTGAFNFHTGMGGYLQNIVNGFMGMRLEFSGNGKLFISPSNSTIIYGINLHNLKFQGSQFNVQFRNESISLELINKNPLKVFASESNTNYTLSVHHRKLVVANQEIVITSA